MKRHNENHVFEALTNLWRSSIVCVCIICLCPSCTPHSGGNREELSTSALTPGSLVTVSIEPLPRRDFIPNGTFENWTALPDTPEGFVPPKPRFSEIAKEQKEIANGAFAVRQTWTGNDGVDSFWRQFHTVIQGLYPSNYVLTVKAKNDTSATIIITASLVHKNSSPSVDGYLPITNLGPVIQIDHSENYQEYTGEIVVRGSGTPASSEQDFPNADLQADLLLSVSCPTNPENYPVTVFWDDWQLLAGKPLDMPKPYATQ